MFASKSTSGLSEAASNKSTPATPRASRLGRAGLAKADTDSPSPLQNSRHSVDRSPKSVESKPTVDRRSPRISAASDKQPRASKASELQAQLNVVEEDLKKAKEQLAFVEKEKTEALVEVKDAERLAEETNEKLQEALAACKRAEESTEIEKFRADELEQAGIEAAQKREEEWQKELESVQSQHALDVSTLHATAQELHRAKHELAMTYDAKNTALSQASDAMKIAEINAEKVEVLSTEVNHLKALLDSKIESISTEAAEVVKKLDSELIVLKQELEKAKAAEEKLVEMESLVDGLKIEVTHAKEAKSDLAKELDDWKKKVELLEAHVEEATQSEKAALDSLASSRKQLEESNASFKDSECQIATLKGRLELLEIEVARYKHDLDESNQSLEATQQQVSELSMNINGLKSELQMAEEEKTKALDNEKAALSNIENLSEQKKGLVDELEISRAEGEKVKKAVEGLTLSLHEVSTEARDAEERLLVKQAEVDCVNTQIEELQLALKNTRESYEVKLDEAKYAITCLKNSIEKLETEAKNSEAEWGEKESSFVNTVIRSEEEVTVIKLEMGKIASSLRGAEVEVEAAKEERALLLDKLKQAESDLTVANKAVEEANAKNLQLKERLLDKESEVQSISQENDELRAQEAAAEEKVKELSALLAEATAKNAEGNGEFESLGSEKECELPPKAIKIASGNAGEIKAEKPNCGDTNKLVELFREETVVQVENGNANAHEEGGTAVHVEEHKMWENYKITDKDLSSDRDHEADSVEDDDDSKVDGSNFAQTNGLSFDNVDNGVTSATKQLQQKKKKALLQKFGSLLKKKNSHKQ